MNSWLAGMVGALYPSVVITSVPLFFGGRESQTVLAGQSAPCVARHVGGERRTVPVIQTTALAYDCVYAMCAVCV